MCNCYDSEKPQAAQLCILNTTFPGIGNVFTQLSQQGPYSSYRLNQRDPNPLLAVVQKRRYHQQVLSEEDTCSTKKRRAAEECFGTNPLPRLEKFTFKLETPQIRCQLKLTGSNVLEGVKQCVLDDHVMLPLPRCLQQMPSYSSNSVLLHSNQVQCNSNSIDQSENG